METHGSLCIAAFSFMWSQNWDDVMVAMVATSSCSIRSGPVDTSVTGT